MAIRPQLPNLHGEIGYRPQLPQFAGCFAIGYRPQLPQVARHRDIKSANVMISVRNGRRVAKIADFGSARSAKGSTKMRNFSFQGGVSEGASGRATFRSSDDDMHVDYRQAEEGRKGHTRSVRGTEAPGAGVGFECPLTSLAEEGRATPGLYGAQKPLELVSASNTPLPHWYNLAEGTIFPARISVAGVGFGSPLTLLVCTPCYRAPEVVMSRGGYTSSLDMWSIGCIMGELLQRVALRGQASTPHLQVAPVFSIRGEPRTPEVGDHYDGPWGRSATTYHELSALFEIIGTPSWACVDALPSPAWRNYLRKIPSRAPKLMRRFGAVGEPAVDLLARFLAFDPSRRCSAEEALGHEFFDDIREVQGKKSFQGPGIPTPAQLQGLNSLEADKVSAPPAPGSACESMDTDDSLEQGVKRVKLDMGSTPTGEGMGRIPFYQIKDPESALDALENELSCICNKGGEDSGDKLVEMLERECEEQRVLQLAGTSSGEAGAPAVSLEEGANNNNKFGCSVKGEAIPPGGYMTIIRADGYGSEMFRTWTHMTPDPGSGLHSSGQDRIPHTADTAPEGVEPETHLKPNRHGEWADSLGDQGTSTGVGWGVGLGHEGDDESTRQAIRLQQQR
eukprot:gene27606-7243_t